MALVSYFIYINGFLCYILIFQYSQKYAIL